MRREPDPGSARRQPPVRRERNEPVAVRAGDGACPEIVRRYGVLLRFCRKPRRQQVFPDLDETIRQTLEFLLEIVPVVARPLGGGAHDERRNRIEVVGKGFKTEPGRLERNASATRRRVEDDKLGESSVESFRQPVAGIVIGYVAECVRVAVRLTFKPLALPPGSVDSASRSHRIAVDSEHMQEPIPIHARRQQGRQHRRPRRHKRTPRPPDVQPVRRRERRHRRALARALDADLRDRQPPLDQPDVSHPAGPTARLRDVIHARRQQGRQHRRPRTPQADAAPTRFGAGNRLLSTRRHRLAFPSVSPDPARYPGRLPRPICHTTLSSLLRPDPCPTLIKGRFRPWPLPVPRSVRAPIRARRDELGSTASVQRNRRQQHG